MKLLARCGLAIIIGAATYFAILRIAEHKADVLAGGDTFRLDPAHPVMRSFEELIDQLRHWKRTDFAESLTALRERGQIWIAPHLGGNRSAIYVSALGLARRIYVRDEMLVVRELPFPHLNVPDDAQRQFVRIRLAGTLFHELQHYNGLEDEKTTYDREVEWYRRLRQDMLAGLEGEAARLFEWAVDSAIQSTIAAREKATGARLDQSTLPEARSSAIAAWRRSRDSDGLSGLVTTTSRSTMPVALSKRRRHS